MDNRRIVQCEIQKNLSLALLKSHETDLEVVEDYLQDLVYVLTCGTSLSVSK